MQICALGFGLVTMFATISAANAGATVSMDSLVRDRIDPQLEYFFRKLSTEKEQLSIDGERPFASDDKFLPGKIAIGLADAMLSTQHDAERLDSMLRDYSAIADLTVHMDNRTWGIYYYLSALHKLKQAGLLDRAISATTLAQLKRQLDWRTFVTQTDYELIDLPTNYFGVAFSVARLRTLLGWEDGNAGKILLEKLLERYGAYSGDFGFSDETPGEGRFDRYSILLIAEICERFVETGTTVTPELKRMLRRSAEIALATAESSGAGFSFGRSIGAYGDTAELEILSIAAYVGVLNAQEKQYAYAYATRIIARYLDFWFDPATQSVDLWGRGRRTDAYRGKNRILGENLSLLHQIVAANALWNKLGFAGIMPKPDLDDWLVKTRPAFSLNWFAHGEYDRALAIFRDQRHVFSLLMVNGGTGQHANSPYYPLPFSSGVIAGVPDSGYAHAQLLPRFTLADGSVLIGAAYLKNIQSSQERRHFSVRYAQNELDRVGAKAPNQDARIRMQTEYVFEPGTITRIDRYTPAAPLPIDEVVLEFASFSTNAKLDGNKVHFADGDVTDFEVDGLDACNTAETHEAEAFRSPTGPMPTLMSCTRRHFTLKEPLTIRWTLKYH